MNLQKTTILITGCLGQLGSELQKIAPEFSNYSFLFTDVAELNLTDSVAVGRYFETNAIDYVINCAAYTAVDKAEDDSELCSLINNQAVRYLAEAAARHNVCLLHVSTDYVFDGSNHLPYKETDPICPQSVYGLSKAAGEQSALTAPRAIIVRTSWLYSSFGENFVKTMIKLGKDRTELNVIFDQIGTPTYAEDLARALLSIVHYCNSRETPSGIYHFSNEGVCSWFDFTRTIHRLSGINTCHVRPITSDQYPTRVARPHYSVLNKQKIKETFNIEIPYWQDSLSRCIEVLNKQ